MNKKNTRKVKVQYNASKHYVKIDTYSNEVYPMYLKYVFAYLKIPESVDIVFRDCVITGGITQWLKETK